MQPVNFLGKLNAKTSNWNGLGGGGFDALIQGDLAAVMMACDAPDLIWSYLFSYYDTGLSYDKYVKRVDNITTKDGTKPIQRWERVRVSCSLNSFAHMIKPWIYSNYLNWIDEPDMIKATQKAARAQDEISHGLALFLSVDPAEEVRLGKYFKPIKVDTFRRKYKRFAIHASRKLFPKLLNLENQIRIFTENENNI
jgi:hypothetical protein